MHIVHGLQQGNARVGGMGELSPSPAIKGCLFVDWTLIRPLKAMICDMIMLEHIHIKQLPFLMFTF